MAKVRDSEVVVNKKLINTLFDESKQLEIMTKRYNFVVDLLDEDQQRTLRQWYIDTGVIKEGE
jgi:hypothetical protein